MVKKITHQEIDRMFEEAMTSPEPPRVERDINPIKEKILDLIRTKNEPQKG